MSKVIKIKLAYPEYKRDSNKYKIDNMFFNYAVPFIKDELYGFVQDGVTVSENVANIFTEVLPADNKYTIELGAELNELYPKFDNHADAFFTVVDNNKDEQKIYVSNQMAKVNCTKDGNSLVILFNQIMKNKLFSESDFELNENNIVSNLKTFITWEFELEGKSVKDIFEFYLDNKIEEFLSLINEFVCDINYILQEKGEFPLIIPSYSRFTIPSFYFIVKGKDSKTGHGIITTHPKGIAYVSDSLSHSQTDQFKNMLVSNYEIDLWDLFFANGKSLIMNGQLKSGILSLFTCCELILSKYIRESLSKKGVSKSKFDDSSKDITFSLMSNILLISVAPEGFKPDIELLGKINSLRRIRNDLIHSGIFDLNYDISYEFVTVVFDFRKYLSDLLLKL